MGIERCDIAVVGGGIVGMASAAALTACGFDVRVIERGAPPATAFDPQRYDPRVYAITPGSARFLEELGLWAGIRETRAAPMQRMQVWDRDPRQALHFETARTGTDQPSWIVEHGLLAGALWRALPAGCMHHATGLLSADLEDGRAHLHLSDGSELQARLAISAEGAESSLREAAGIDTTGWSYAATAVVCHLECSEPHRGTALQRFLPSGPVALLPLADGRRSLVWSTTDTDARELLALDDASFASHLQDAVQSAAGTLGATTRRLTFPLRLMHARRYVAPGCVLVGDSAHLIHPLAGQGLNIGLADAHELALVLREARTARRDWSAPRTLARYERARQAANLEMLAMTDVLGRAFSLDLPGLQRLLHLGLRTVERLPPLKQALAAQASGSG
ncbi:MAG: UbiH/UbiF/VisC/COQ6 family ubiquinone biosynthesis hydroxylase [Panacagrimonas sp.]